MKNLKKWITCFAVLGVLSISQTAFASCDGQELWICDSEFQTFLEHHDANCQPGDRVLLNFLDC